jgi:hypothetical protein
LKVQKVEKRLLLRAEKEREDRMENPEAQNLKREVQSLKREARLGTMEKV